MCSNSEPESERQRANERERERERERPCVFVEQQLCNVGAGCARAACFAVSGREPVVLISRVYPSLYFCVLSLLPRSPSLIFFFLPAMARARARLRFVTCRNGKQSAESRKRERERRKKKRRGRLHVRRKKNIVFWGKCSTFHSPPALFFFFFSKVEICSRALIQLFGQDKSTVAKQAETTVTECSLKSCV